MIIIATRDLSKGDMPQEDFNWSTFSMFALTFDPLSEAKDEFNQVPASAIPSDVGCRPNCKILKMTTLNIYFSLEDGVLRTDD